MKRHTAIFGVVVTLLAVRLQADRLRTELVERGRLLTEVAAGNATDALVLLEIQELRSLLGETDAADRILGAVRAVIGEGEKVTYDIKRSVTGSTDGCVGTQAYADALIERL